MIARVASGWNLVWLDAYGDDGRTRGVAVVEELVEVAAVLVLERRHAPVVDNEDVECVGQTKRFGLPCVGLRGLFGAS